MKRLFTSCFGLGFMPVAPGTWGSVPVAVIFAILAYLQTSPVVISLVMLALALIGSVVCVLFAPSVIAKVGKKDPGEIVADEFAGQAVTFLYLGTIARDQVFTAALIGFFVFRLFDILKPWPIHKLEKLPQGWGILADDLLAGVYAAIVLQIALRWWTCSNCG